MKSILFLLYFCCFFIINVIAQDTAPFQLKDQKGITLSKKNISLLVDKTWTTYKQYYVNKEEASTFSGSFMAFKFLPDGQFRGTAGNRSLSGTWALEKKRIVNLLINEQSDIDQEVKIGGAYSIYKLSDGELVMVKNLTSDFSMRIIYYLKGSKTSVLAETPNTTATSPVSQVDKKALEEARKNRDLATLISEVETEAQLRGIKVREKLDKMDLKALQSLKNQILSGEYKKRKTKT